MPIYTGRKVNGLSDGKWLPSPEGVYNDGDITDVFGAVSVWGLGPSHRNTVKLICRVYVLRQLLFTER